MRAHLGGSVGIGGSKGVWPVAVTKTALLAYL